VGLEPTISAGERPQTYALDRAATGTGNHPLISRNNFGSHVACMEREIKTLVGEAWREEAVRKPQAYMEEYDYNGTQKKRVVVYKLDSFH